MVVVPEVVPGSTGNGTLEPKQICEVEAPGWPEDWTTCLLTSSETENCAWESALPDGLSTSKLSGSDTGWYDEPQLKLTPPSATPRKSPEAAEDVVTVPDVVF